METKKCSKCKEEKPESAEYFVRSKKGKNGLAASCKDCTRKYREQNKERIRTTAKKYSEENKEKINAHSKEYRKLNKEKRIEYDKRPEVQERKKRYRSTPEHRERKRTNYHKNKHRHVEKRREYDSRPEVLERRRKKAKEFRDSNPEIIKARSKENHKKHLLKMEKDPQMRDSIKLLDKSIEDLERALEASAALDNKTDKGDRDASSKDRIKLYKDLGLL